MSEHQEHYFSLAGQETFKLKGVKKVETFDEGEIVIETNGGPMMIKGEKLHINHLNLEDGDIIVWGLIKTIQYLDMEKYMSAKEKGKGIIKRLLK